MRHLIIDGVAQNGLLLKDTKALSEWLVGMAKYLNMAVMKKPTVVEVVGFGPDAGITGIVVISESHMAIHTWPEKKDCNVNIDIFSCRQFNWKDVLAKVTKDWRIGTDDYKIRVISRPIGGGDALHE